MGAGPWTGGGTVLGGEGSAGGRRGAAGACSGAWGAAAQLLEVMCLVVLARAS